MLPAEAARAGRPAEPAARPLRSLAALACALVLAAAGCGDSDDSEPAPGSGSELTVVLDSDGPGGEPEREARVSCGEGGDACAELERLAPADFATIPPQTACTEIFGGHDTATVAGTLEGEPVSAKLTRANGCEIERFDRFTDLLTTLFPNYEPGASPP